MITLRADAPLEPQAYGEDVNWAERIESRATAAVRPLYLDIGLAAFFVVLCSITVNTQEITGLLHEARPFDQLTAFLVAAPIALRRIVPLSALTISCAAIFVHVVTHAPDGTTPLAVAVLVYSVAAWTPLDRALAGLGVTAIALIGIGVFGDGELPAFDVAFTIALFGILWAGGVAMRARRESSELRLRRATELAQTEANRAARAVAEERLRIAQDLHDVVGHSMSVIAVQAGVGSHFLDSNTEKAREALDAIGSTSRSTLNEMRRLLGVLRDDVGDRSHIPAPTLGQLPELVDDIGRLGVNVKLEFVGEPEIEHRAIEMSAYRVVQEALTNVIKHAGPTSSVDVRVEHLAAELRIGVTDDGRGATAAVNGAHPATGQHGLIGMRERVDVWGGSLHTGPRAGGGFEVVATFPYGAES